MSLVVYAPNTVVNDHNPTLFLAGSIEMGKAEDWQQAVITMLEGEKITIYNPRRRDWDSSWKQSKDNPQFREQVEWELTHIHNTSFVMFYFQPGTLSPISLLELGSVCNDPSSTPIVICPEGFWRKGNVDIYCEYLGVPVYDTLEEGIKKLKQELNESTTINRLL